MELSPKQQSVELIKKSQRVLILGHKEPSGDFLGSALAFSEALKTLGKETELIITDAIPVIYKFLPFIDQVKSQFQNIGGKILRINTQKAPIKSMQWQKSDKHLDIILDTEKNLKFEFIEIINGDPKPDLIIALNTTDVQKLDKLYDANTEMFFEVPIINIDHHAGNDYFGTVNLIDLTATSSAEILVALFEALGIKIENPDIATCLLAGIISETQSFRTQNTTPKSLTVAAQLLAAGARQQEIISNLYKKRPMALLKLWGDMLTGISQDKDNRFAWTKVALSQVTDGITCEDVFDAADELLSNTPDADLILILCEKEPGVVSGKIKAVRGKDALELANLFGGEGVAANAFFEINDLSLADSELRVLKTIHDFWAKTQNNQETREVWDVMGTNQKSPDGQAKIPDRHVKRTDKSQSEKIKSTVVNDQKRENREQKNNPKTDIIDKAINSLEKEERLGGFASIGDVIKKKQKPYLKEEIDVFEEGDESSTKEMDI